MIQSFHRHVFVLLALLGCLAPWLTPRLDPQDPQKNASLEKEMSWRVTPVAFVQNADVVQEPGWNANSEVASNFGVISME